MSLRVAPVPTVGSTTPAPPVLRGRRLVLARTAWVAVALLALLLFVATIALRWTQLSASMDGTRTGVAQLGISTLYPITIDIALRLSFFAVGMLIFWHKSNEWMALFISLMLVTIGATPDNATIAVMEPVWRVLSIVLGSFGWTAIWLLLYLFPDGRFVPRWTRLLAAIFIVGQGQQLLVDLFPNLSVGAAAWLHVPESVAAPLLLGSCVFAQVYRYRRVSSPVQRQQTKWVVFGVTLALSIGVLINTLLSELVPSLQQAGSLPNLVAQTLAVGPLFLIPLSIGIAILRYRLWEIDILINRTLVYGALTASVVGIYVLVVGALGALMQARGSLFISLLATGGVAVLFQPLRDRLQRAINRLLYGERDDPYAVLTRLGQRLEATLAPDTVLPTIVQTVTEALKLPYAALALNGPAGLTVVAVHGTPADTPLHLPLAYQNEPLGELRLAPRTAGEAFSPGDRRLLDDLARQAGVAAYAVRLTADLRRVNAELQRSRARLVTTREEERRRLRRDLHDGLGPALAAQTLKVGTAKYLVPRDPPAAEALLTELEADIGAALAQIRQVVYNLRPPALDELGLVGAIRASAGQYYPQWANAGGGDDMSGLRVVVVAPERLAPLPAAVEVAAYRIVHEALANVVRHAHAQTCQIQLVLVEQGEQLLCLDITDDGCGLPRERHQGVGLATMRERAAELGGSCVVAPGPTGGTWVRARLPLPPPPELADQERVAA